jgi:hypothetical protein
MMADGEAGAEIYAAGATKDQAGILFRDAVKMVDKSPDLDSRIRRSGGPGREFNLAWLAKNSFFRPISREARKTGSGPRPHFALCDEIHEHPDRGVIEMLERGFKFRRQPLLLMITNSGTDRNSICWEEHEHAIRSPPAIPTPRTTIRPISASRSTTRPSASSAASIRTTTRSRIRAAGPRPTRCSASRSPRIISPASSSRPRTCPAGSTASCACISAGGPTPRRHG